MNYKINDKVRVIDSATGVSVGEIGIIYKILGERLIVRFPKMKVYSNDGNNWLLIIHKNYSKYIEKIEEDDEI